MTDADETRKIFEEAIDAFPYPNLQTTSITQGELEVDEYGDIEYGEEYTFDAGKLLDEDLVGGGWIEVRSEYGDGYISAFFVVARNGDFKNQLILGENEGLQGEYDVSDKKWTFYIDKM